jgi:hypothetical protein
VRVYLESGSRRTFAMAVEWPGWGRSGRTAEAAINALLLYHPRYAVVARAAGLELPDIAAGAGSSDRAGSSGYSDSYGYSDRSVVDVVERVPGNATTEYGAPGAVPTLDDEGWTPTEARRQTALLAAAWTRFDEVVAAAPALLRKGPRGGGRDRDKIVEHVLGTEPAYARKAGWRFKGPPDRSGLDELRARLVALLNASPGPAATASGWPAPYTVRRLAWHALDHAWEIEDRSQPEV